MSPVLAAVIGAVVVITVAVALVVARRRRAERATRIRRITEPPRMSFAGRAFEDGERRAALDPPPVPAAYVKPRCACGAVVVHGQAHFCRGIARSGS